MDYLAYRDEENKIRFQELKHTCKKIIGVYPTEHLKKCLENIEWLENMMNNYE